MFNWLKNLFQRTSGGGSQRQAHLTFGATSVGRTVSRTALLLKKQLWIWPIIAVVLLAIVGYGIHTAIERTMKASLRAELETLLNIERSMLETWLKVQESNAESLANDQQIRELTTQILSTRQPSDDQTIKTDSLHSRLAQELSPGMSAHNFERYILVD